MSTQMAGRYRFDELIAAGGFGEVWRGTDVTLGRTVAIKLLQPACAQDPAILARFRAEARNAAALCHPHIAAIHDFCEPPPPGAPFLVMEYVAGPSLAALLADGPIGAASAMRVLAEAALGLAAAHQAGLVHRDIKPGNLLLDREVRVKITDFGISHAAGSAPLTNTGVLVGTPAYMAPERIAGARGSTASDIYSLGVVAYHAVTGTVPFSGEPLDVAVASRERPLPPLPDSIPHEVAAFIMRLTAKDPAARPPHARDVARTAERLCGELTAGPAPGSRRGALLGPGGRRRPTGVPYPTRKQPGRAAGRGPSRLGRRSAVAVAAIMVTLAGVYLAANGGTAAAPRTAGPSAAAMPDRTASSPPSRAHGPQHKAAIPPSRAPAPDRTADATALTARTTPVTHHHHGRDAGHGKARNHKGHGPDAGGPGNSGGESGDS